MSIQFKALSAGSADCPPAPYVFNSTYTFNKDISGCMISPSQGLLYDPNSKIDITWNFSSGSCNSYINGAFAAAGSRVFSFGTRYLCGSDRYDQHTSVTSSLSGSSVSNAPICPECAGDHVTLYLAIEKSTGVTYAGGVEVYFKKSISTPSSSPTAVVPSASPTASPLQPIIEPSSAPTSTPSSAPTSTPSSTPSTSSKSAAIPTISKSIKMVGIFQLLVLTLAINL